jgi:hypothetical protein
MYARGTRRASARSPSDAPVLLPSRAGETRPLPGWLTIVALAGLALLLCSTVPAVLRRARLTTDLGRLHDELTGQEREVRRLERELHAARADSFAHEQALQRLLHPLATPTRPDGR